MRPFSSPRSSSLRCVHLVDRCLLLFMLVLLAQSVFSLFFPASGQNSGDIDVMVRTSAAAIFGYFLSANFIRRDPAGGQSPAAQQTRILELGGEQTGQTGGPTARIGFAAPDTAADQLQAGGAEAEPSAPPSDGSCLQVAVATAIGLFCLTALLVLRNLEQLGILTDQSALSATVTQFRDFVSACVGFLIGCPTQQNDPTSES